MFIQKPFSLTTSTGDEDGYVPKGAIWFDGAADYLTKTFASAALNTKGTYSFWMKRGIEIPATTETFISVGSGSGPAVNTWMNIRFQSGDQMWANDYSYLRLRTTQVFRDPAAWYHLVFRFDTTLDAADSRFRIYVNGEQISSYVSRVNYSQNDDVNLSGNGSPFLIGQWNSSEYFNGRLSEFVFLDGYSAPPADFATEDSNGVWIPKDPTSTVTTNKGTNGFWLDFADSADLGNDVSYSGLGVGNDNSFTASGNLSADNWTYDRPADDSDTKTGNIAVFSPIDTQDSTGYLPNILSNGNRTSTMQGSVPTQWGNGNLLTVATNSGKWYCEGIIVTRSSGTYGTNYPTVGLVDGGQDSQGGNIYGAVVYAGTGTGTVQGSGAATYLPGGSPNGTKLQFAIDHENGAFYVGQNGTWGNSATTAEIEGGTTTNALANTGGTGNALGAWSALTDGTYLALAVGTFQSEFTIWVTEDEWDYTPPTGFLSLGTQNLPSVTVTKPTNNFLPILYEGNGGSQRVGNFIPFTDSKTVTNSAVFDSGGSDYLSKTYSASAASSSTIWTFSTWFKRGLRGGDYHFLGAGTDTSNYEALSLGSSGNLIWITKTSGSITGRYDTNIAIQGPATWYNLVISRSGATVTISINGVVQATDAVSPTVPGASDVAYFGRPSMTNAVGARYVGSADNYWDGYLAETVFIDGTAYAASSFGETDTSTNRWIPKDVSGLDFGNNGFYFNYSDSAELGDDTSGKGNDFAENNMVAANQTVDTPTQNYSTLNPLIANGSDITLSGGNLIAAGASGNWGQLEGTFPITEGTKGYYETKISGTSTANIIGWGESGGRDGTGGQSFAEGDTIAFQPGSDALYTGTASTASWASYSATADDILMFAYDATDIHNVKFWFGEGGTWFQSGDPAAGTNAAVTYDCTAGTITGGPWVPLVACHTITDTFNFGSGTSGFTYTAPTGFLPLNQDNMAANTAGITGLSWIKNRDATADHILQDRVRGVYEYIISNDTDVEETNANSVQKFLQQGVQVGNMATVNTSANSFVLWNWVGNGTGTLNEDGNLNSTVSANTDAAFSIINYTGSGSSTTIGHGMGKKPEFMIFKNRGTTNGWIVWHKNLSGITYYLSLDGTDAESNASGAAVWDSTEPTSSVISIGTDATTNASTNTYVCYCWASVPGSSHFYHYDGNGQSGDLAPYLYLGFKPSFFMHKRIDSTDDWRIVDNQRDRYNPVQQRLAPNSDAGESTYADMTWDFTSNGVKLRGDDTGYNADGGKYIYAAFAENPFGGSGIGQAKAR